MIVLEIVRKYDLNTSKLVMEELSTYGYNSPEAIIDEDGDIKLGLKIPDILINKEYPAMRFRYYKLALRYDNPITHESTYLTRPLVTKNFFNYISLNPEVFDVTEIGSRKDFDYKSHFNFMFFPYAALLFTSNERDYFIIQKENTFVTSDGYYNLSYCHTLDNLKDRLINMGFDDSFICGLKQLKIIKKDTT